MATLMRRRTRTGEPVTTTPEPAVAAPQADELTALIEAARGGDRDAFEEVVRRAGGGTGGSSKKSVRCKDRVRYVGGVPVQIAASDTEPYARGMRSAWVIGEDGSPQRISASSKIGDAQRSVLVAPPEYSPTAADFDAPPEGCWVGSTSDTTSYGNKGRKSALARPRTDAERAAMAATAEANIVDTPKVRYGLLREKLQKLGITPPSRSSYVHNKESLTWLALASAHLTADTGTAFLGKLSGPPGTGKTFLAETLAAEFGGALFEYRCHEDSQISGTDGLMFAFDAHSAVRSEGAIKRTAAWQAFEFSQRGEGPAVLLIDEIDKAPPEFHNALLRLVETGEFESPTESESGLELGVDEHGRVVADLGNLIIVMTTNETKTLPDALASRINEPLDFTYPNAKEISERVTAMLGKGLTPEEADEVLRPNQIQLATRMATYLRDWVMSDPDVRGDAKAEAKAENKLPTVREIAALCRNLTLLSDQDTASSRTLDAEVAARLVASLFIKDGLPGFNPALSDPQKAEQLAKIFGIMQGPAAKSKYRRNDGTIAEEAYQFVRGTSEVIDEAIAASSGKGRGLFAGLVTDTRKTRKSLGPKS